MRCAVAYLPAFGASSVFLIGYLTLRYFGGFWFTGSCITSSRKRSAGVERRTTELSNGSLIWLEGVPCDGLAVLEGEQARKNITAREIIGFSASST